MAGGFRWINPQNVICFCAGPGGHDIIAATRAYAAPSVSRHGADMINTRQLRVSVLYGKNPVRRASTLFHSSTDPALPTSNSK